MLILNFKNDSAYRPTESIKEVLFSDGFYKLSTPIVFKAINPSNGKSEWVVIAHGEPGRLAAFKSLSDFRRCCAEYGVPIGDEITLISCFGGTLNKREAKENKIVTATTMYPLVIADRCYYSAEEEDVIKIGLFETDNDVMSVIDDQCVFHAKEEGYDWDSLPDHIKSKARDKIVGFYMQGRRYAETIAKKGD